MRRDAVSSAPGEQHWTWVDRLSVALQSVAHQAGTTADCRSFARESARVDHVTGDQVEHAIVDGAELVTVMTGTAELWAGRTHPDDLATRLEGAVRRLRASGADVVLVTALNPQSSLVSRRRRSRAAEFTSDLWSIARQHGASVVDAWSIRDVRTRPFGATERVALEPEGHRVLACRTIEALALPYRDGVATRPIRVSESLDRLPG